MDTYTLPHHKLYHKFTIQITSPPVSVWHYPHCAVGNDPLMVKINCRVTAQNLRLCGDEYLWCGSLLSETVLCGWLMCTKLTHSYPEDRGTIFVRNVSYHTVPRKTTASFSTFASNLCLTKLFNSTYVNNWQEVLYQIFPFL